MTLPPRTANPPAPRVRVHRAARGRKAALVTSLAGFVGLTGWLALAPAVSNTTASKSVVTSRENDDDDEGATSSNVATGSAASTSSSTSSSYGAAVPASSSNAPSTRTVSHGS